MYIYINIYIYHIYTYTCQHTFTYVCIRIYVYTHISIYICICMHIHMYVCIYIHTHITHINSHAYGVAAISRLLKSIGLFCRIQFLLQGSFAKETYNLNEPTNSSHSHPIHTCRYALAVATIRRLLESIGLVCKRALQKRRYSVKETYDLKEPTKHMQILALASIDVIGWLRLICSLKLQFSFAKKSPIKETVFCKRDL